MGKYTELNDSYKSLIESINHACVYHNRNVHITWINAREYEGDMKELNNLHGIIIPGGFGNNGIENIIMRKTFITMSNNNDFKNTLYKIKLEF